MTITDYRVVCALVHRHPLHAMHIRPTDSYTDAVHLAHQLDHEPEAMHAPTAAACTPHTVECALVMWEPVA